MGSMATRTNSTKPKPTPESDEHALVRLADTSHFDQVCIGTHVFDRGEPPIHVTLAEAQRMVADAAGALVMEESA